MPYGVLSGCDDPTCMMTTGRENPWQKSFHEACTPRFNFRPTNIRFAPDRPRQLGRKPSPVRWCQKPVTIWDPNATFGTQLKCPLRLEAVAGGASGPVCNGVLKPRTRFGAARYIYAEDGGEYLIAAQYQCPKCRSFILASDDAILSQLDPITEDAFPFVLTKHGAVTKVQLCALPFVCASLSSCFLFWSRAVLSICKSKWPMAN